MSYDIGTHFNFRKEPERKPRHVWAIPGTRIRFVPIRFLDDLGEPIAINIGSPAIA